MIRIGLVGQPSVGKSTLFNVLTGASVETAEYEFTTIEPNTGTLLFRDKEAEALRSALGYGEIKYPEIQVIDIAGLVDGASDGRGMGNQFLGQILICDLIVLVLRSDMPDHKSTVLHEMRQFDLANLQKPFEKARRQRRLYPKDPAIEKYESAVVRTKQLLEDNVDILNELTDQEVVQLSGIDLISLKKRIEVVNTYKDETIDSDLSVNLLNLEAALRLSTEDLSSLGISDLLLPDFHAALSNEIRIKLELSTFYTVGKLGVGVWVYEKGKSVAEASALLHVEMQDEIKNARICPIQCFIDTPNWDGVQSSGLTKTIRSNTALPDKQVVQFL